MLSAVMQSKEESAKIKKSFFKWLPDNHQIRNIFHRFGMPLIIRIMINFRWAQILLFFLIVNKTGIRFGRKDNLFADDCV